MAPVGLPIPVMGQHRTPAVDDATYHAERMRTEVGLATRATNPRARNAHLELAYLHACRGGGIPATPPGEATDAARKSRVDVPDDR